MFGFSFFPKTVSVTEALEKLDADGHVLIDVRSKDEFRSGHATGAINIPLDRLEAELARLGDHTSIHVMCRSGGRSAMATQLLHANGLTHAINVAGGMLAWERAGLPTKRG